MSLRGGPRSLVLETAILMPASVQSSTLFLIGTKELLQQNKEIYLADTLAKIERIQIDNGNLLYIFVCLTIMFLTIFKSGPGIKSTLFTVSDIIHAL